VSVNMVMPIDFVLIRHGQSEANVVQKIDKGETGESIPEAFYQRHDSRMRLTTTGVQQAQAAGDWLRANNLDNFAHHYVSPHIRACETAAHLKLGAEWRVDDRWRERDWGHYGMLNKQQKTERYPEVEEARHLSEWYWHPPGGESLATGVRLRIKDIYDTLHREVNGETFVAVTHGETIRTNQFVIERHTPASWEIMDSSEQFKIMNCQIVHYSRRNPFTGEVGGKLSWMRSICPWDETKSWSNGEWVEFTRQTFSDAELLAGVEIYDRLF
jgi:broad specificity phosphatase PhoE